jgi:hypothetical protein
VVIYGLGNLDKIKNDPELSLKYKISSPSAQPNPLQNLPSAAQICERVNLIIKMLVTPNGTFIVIFSHFL